METPLPEVARVHEKTVIEAEKHAGQYEQPRQRRARRERPEGRRRSLRISAEVMETAHSLVGPDQHVRVTSTGEVFILNGSNSRPEDVDVIGGD